MRLSIIIVTHNSSDHIEDCIKSVLDNLPKDSEIIVVDSGSEDKTKNILKAYKEVILIESKENIGFGKGANLGLKKAKGQYLFFLNPDTKVTDDAIAKLLEFAEGKEFGIIAPKLIEPGGKIQESVTHFPTIWNAVKEFYLGLKNSYSQYAPDSKDALEVECVYGAAMMIKKSVFEKLKGFDERYFMYFEDLDFCRKIKKLELKIYYLPFVKIYHEVGGTMKKDSPSLSWSHQSAKIYHGLFYYYLLYLILWLRPKKH